MSSTLGVENRPPLKTNKPRKEKLRNSKSRGKNFTDFEINLLLEIIEEVKPCGGLMWEDVAERYRKRIPRDFDERDVESLKKKFANLKNHSKPTGDPSCPPAVITAKRLAREIEIECAFTGASSDPEPEADAGTNHGMSKSFDGIDSSDKPDSFERNDESQNCEDAPATEDFESLLISGESESDAVSGVAADKRGESQPESAKQFTPRVGQDEKDISDLSKSLASSLMKRKRNSSDPRSNVARSTPPDVVASVASQKRSRLDNAISGIAESIRISNSVPTSTSDTLHTYILQSMEYWRREAEERRQREQKQDEDRRRREEKQEEDRRRREEKQDQIRKEDLEAMRKERKEDNERFMLLLGLISSGKLRPSPDKGDEE